MTIEVAFVYSQILYRAICSHDESFDKAGKPSKIPIVKDQDGVAYIPIGFDIVYSIVQPNLMSRPTFYKVRDELVKDGHISKMGVRVYDGVLKSYFELKTDAKTKDDAPLRAIPCIIYSYLLDKTKAYKGVDKCNRKIADLFNVPFSTLGRILYRLKQLELITSTNYVGKKSVIVATYNPRENKKNDAATAETKQDEQKQEGGVVCTEKATTQKLFDLDADERTRGWRNGDIQFNKLTLVEKTRVMQAINIARMTPRTGTT